MLKAFFATSGVNLESMTAKARVSKTASIGSHGQLKRSWAILAIQIRPPQILLRVEAPGKFTHRRHGEVYSRTSSYILNALKRLRMPWRRNREGAFNTHLNGERIYAFYYGRKNPASEKNRLCKKQHFPGNISFEIKSCVQEQSKITGCFNLRIDMNVGWVVRRKGIDCGVRSFLNGERFAFGKVEVGFPLPAPFRNSCKGVLNTSLFFWGGSYVLYKFLPAELWRIYLILSLFNALFPIEFPSCVYKILLLLDSSIFLWKVLKMEGLSDPSFWKATGYQPKRAELALNM